MRDLQDLPKFEDRWSHLYLEHGRIDEKANALLFHGADGTIEIPIDQLGLVLLGPGTTATHAAMRFLADNNTLVCWTGEQGVRLYAHSTGGTHASRRLLRQAMLYSDMDTRIAVIRRMYNKRFHEQPPESASLDVVRGMEGYRVREVYRKLACEYGVEWRGRNYDPADWECADPVNRALSAASACLYGLCHAAILSAGYSPAIGFIHTGKMLSFVYDVADLYKTEVAVPAAFQAAAEDAFNVERRTRLACRDIFHRTKLMRRILPDIAEVLDARDDIGESPDELEGRIITMDDRAASGTLPWQSERESARPVVEQSDGED
jgi:CRISPR-associated protein Cas1